jgi:hypothetical protein
MAAVSDVARCVHAFSPSLRGCGNTLCSGGWNPAVGALADIRRGSTDRAVLHYGGESERKSGIAGIGRGSVAAGGLLAEPNVKPRSTAPPVRGPLHCDGTSQHGTGSTPEFGLPKTQGLAYDGEHTMEAPLFFPLVSGMTQREEQRICSLLTPRQAPKAFPQIPLKSLPLAKRDVPASRSIPFHRLRSLLSRRSGPRTAATVEQAVVRGQFI